jgi:hypothetical protein
MKVLSLAGKTSRFLRHYAKTGSWGQPVFNQYVWCLFPRKKKLKREDGQCLVPKLRMCDAMPPLHHIHSRLSWGPTYLWCDSLDSSGMGIRGRGAGSGDLQDFISYALVIIFIYGFWIWVIGSVVVITHSKYFLIFFLALWPGTQHYIHHTRGYRG